MGDAFFLEISLPRCVEVSSENVYLCRINHSVMDKENKNLNRIKVVLAEKNLQNKWLAEQIGRDQATVSKWVTNSAQPNLETLIKIAQVLKVEIGELVRTDEVVEG